MNKRSFLKLFGLGAASLGASLIPSTPPAKPPKSADVIIAHIDNHYSESSAVRMGREFVEGCASGINSDALFYRVTYSPPVWVDL